jgi:hypothetical protein
MQNTTGENRSNSVEFGAFRNHAPQRHSIFDRNTVDDCSMPGILVTSTAGLHLSNNALHLRSDSNHLPLQMRQAGLKEARPVVEIQCDP